MQSLPKIISVHSLAIRFEPNAREWLTIGCSVLSPWRLVAVNGALQLAAIATRGRLLRFSDGAIATRGSERVKHCCDGKYFSPMT